MSFKKNGRESYGIVDGDEIQEPGAAFLLRHPNLISVLDAGISPDVRGGENHAIHEVNLLPPIPEPSKILCVGVNYLPHIQEMGREVPGHPVVFVRFANSLVGHGEAIVRPRVSEKYDFEGELAIVIGKRARHIKKADAFDVIAGFSCFMDGSVRDWQNHTPQFTPGKNFPLSGAMGPWLVTSEAIADAKALSLTTRLNGAIMQEGSLADLVFDIPALIEYCSTFTELMPGDIIATGTPGGVGAARTPPVWLKPDDLVEVEIPGVGLLANRVTGE